MGYATDDIEYQKSLNAAGEAELEAANLRKGSNFPVEPSRAPDNRTSAEVYTEDQEF